MSDELTQETKAVWIRKAPLLRRWGDMPVSTFHDRLKRGQVPKPEFPFGRDTPFWRMSVIEEFERPAQEEAA